MFLNGYALHEEPCTDPYARFCGQTEASAPSDPIIRHNWWMRSAYPPYIISAQPFKTAEAVLLQVHRLLNFEL